jgi:hypothetical protein
VAAARYGDVHAGFVHHTVNANNYTRREVPAILRGIYAYHTQSRGWRDIGYNYLIDRFGRIWEGRYGGVTLPVVGAHTLDYNENSFGTSAIGNYQIARPTSAMLDAYARLFAWKLSLSGVGRLSSERAGDVQRHQWASRRGADSLPGHPLPEDPTDHRERCEVPTPRHRARRSIRSSATPHPTSSTVDRASGDLAIARGTVRRASSGPRSRSRPRDTTGRGRRRYPATRCRT